VKQLFVAGGWAPAVGQDFARTAGHTALVAVTPARPDQQ